jgi:hypothetical protein
MFQGIPLHVLCDPVQQYRLAFQKLFDNVRVGEANDQEAEMNETDCRE